MPELPEYKKQRHTVEPAPIVSGIQSTYNNMAKGTEWIGRMGASIAQNAANQLATLKGEEEAINNPNRQLFPAFTEADSHFVKAFENEAYNGAVQSANQLLQKQYETVLSQPLSSESLALFEKNSVVGLDNIMQSAPRSAF